MDNDIMWDIVTDSKKIIIKHTLSQKLQIAAL